MVYREYPTRNLIFSGTHSSLYTKKNKAMIARWIFHGIPREDYERAFDNLSSHPKFNETVVYSCSHRVFAVAY